jgi:5-methyltetrahydropteroyltriglutamate--homocysteine methyltransferase
MLHTCYSERQDSSSSYGAEIFKAAERRVAQQPNPSGGEAMQVSSERILTTHIGSLPQTAELHERLMARSSGGTEDAGLDEDVRLAAADSVRRQVEAGLSVVNDGEQGKTSWAAYVRDRLSGLSGENIPRPAPRDAADFPDYYSRAALPAATAGRPACNGPLSWKDFSGVERDIANLQAAVAGQDVAEVFMSSSSPGNVSNFHPNRHYPSEEQYLEAIAEVMRREYEAIVAAGFLLQLDCPDLAIQGMYFPEATDEEFQRIVGLRIEALNYATRNIPPESMRMHVCWGRGEPARIHDQPLLNLVGLYLKGRPMGLTIVGANGRHEHEWKVWKDVKLPDDKVLVPGVIDNTTSIIEHRETVADRILRYATVVGRERVIGGVNCGFGNELSAAIPDVRIVWAKLRALADGAEIASRELWG